MNGEYSVAYVEIDEGKPRCYLDGKERKNFIADCLEADRERDAFNRCSILTLKTGERLKVADEVLKDMEQMSGKSTKLGGTRGFQL